MSDDGKEMPRSVTFQVTTKKKTTGHEREFVKISIPRFSGGAAQEWLRWIQQFEHVSQVKKWTSEEKALHLNLVLDDEALSAWKTASDKVNVDDKDEFEAAYKTWGHMFVPSMYHERLEEELFLFAKKKTETVAECHQRMRQITRMLSNLPSNALDLDEKMLIRTFKRAMPNEWKTAYERSGVYLDSMPKTVQYFERLEQSEKRQGLERRGKSWKKAGGKNGGDKNHKDGKASKKGGNQSQQKSQKQKGDKWCSLHKTSSHSDSECFTQK
ncbi:hypothetical protein DVH05_016861 [Phytophthora capsici]|nr:hypothetical protein DVH05_016861 [Phytophthora capsici]